MTHASVHLPDHSETPPILGRQLRRREQSQQPEGVERGSPFGTVEPTTPRTVRRPVREEPRTPALLGDLALRPLPGRSRPCQQVALNLPDHGGIPCEQPALGFAVYRHTVSLHQPAGSLSCGWRGASDNTGTGRRGPVALALRPMTSDDSKPRGHSDLVG